jgi:WD40 repeat protein/tetratricopeptide (TPR) repeat protein
MDTGAERATLRGHSAWVGCVTFHPGGWCLLSGGRHFAEVKLWDLTRPQEHRALAEASSTAMVFDKDGHHVFLVAPTGRLQKRQTESGWTQVGGRVDMSIEYLTPAVVAEYSADARRLVTAGSDRTLVKIWDTATSRELTTLRGLSNRATYLACSHDGARVAAAGLKAVQDRRFRDIKVWDTATGQVLFAFTPSRGPTRFTHGRVALSRDGERVAFDDYEDGDIVPATGLPAGHPVLKLRVCEVSSGRELLHLRLGPSVLFCLAFSPDGNVVTAGDQDGNLRAWDVSSGTGLYETKLPPQVFRLAFSPDGRRLAGVDREQVRVWDARDGREILILRSAPPRSLDGGFNPTVVWSPDGRQLASLNWDRTVSIFDGSERFSAPADRWSQANRRVFAWHLSEAESAVAGGQVDAAAFHLGKMREQDPPDITSLRRRAHLFLRLGQRDRARDDFARWRASGEPDEGSSGLSYARLLLISGDHQGYHQLCTRMLTDLEEDPRRAMAWNAARAFGLAPCPAAEAARLIHLVEQQFPDQHRWPQDLYALALIRYRAGQWKPAHAALQESMNKDPELAWRCRPLMAMIQHRLGQTSEARTNLIRATQWLSQHQDQHERSTSSLFDEEWFDYQWLCKEAGSVLAVGPK